MKYDTVKAKLVKLGAQFLTEDEMRTILKEHVLFTPFGCLNCDKAYGKHDFSDILYFLVNNNKLDRWAQRYGGITLGPVDYGMIARCRFCGHCDVDAEV